MKHVDKSGLIISLFVVVLSTLAGELVKILVSSQNVLISIVFLILGLGIIFVLDKLNDKRIASGKNAQSIAVRSSQFINEYFRKVKEIVRDNKWKDNENEIYATVQSISRHLLLIGEYKIRYSLGKIIYRNTSNPLYQMKSLIDEMGWTSVLMGKRRSVSEIEKAILLSAVTFSKNNDQYILHVDELDDITFEKIFLVSRALRHLASIQFKTIEERIALSEQSLEALSFLENHQTQLPKDITIEKINEMRSGVYYGLGLVNLMAYNNKSVVDKANHLSYLANAHHYNQESKLMSKDYINRHRYLKCLLIENEIYNSVTTKNIIAFPSLQKEAEKNQNFAEILNFTCQDYANNLREVERILNSSVYIDEAYEMFLEEKIRPEVEKRS